MINEFCPNRSKSPDANTFKSPPLFFRPGVLFPILCEEDLSNLTEKFLDLKEKGIGRVAPWLIPASRYEKYTGSTLGIDYDTPEYWQALKTIQAAAEETGLSIILHDEPGWPSGQAGGRILEKGGDGWMRRTLHPTDADPLNTEPLKKGSINPETPQPDLLNPAIGTAMVKLAHQRHKEQLGGNLPDCMSWVYADEPTFGGIGHNPVQEFIWTPGLENLFQQRYGYRIEPFLPELIDETLETLPRETAQARIDYFDLIAHLFETNYLKPIFEWCEQNNVASGGHLLLEHDPRRFMEGGHGHLLRSYRYFHLPGIDSIFRESHPYTRNHYFPKYASSIARQTARFCSSMPFGASSCAVTPAIFKWTIDHELVRGINLFLPWGYSPNPDIRYQWSRPVFGHFGPLWKYMDIAYLYTARLSYLLSCGVPDCRTALYFDMRSIWAGEPWRSDAIEKQEAIAQMLLETQHDFDFVDDLSLKQADVSASGELIIEEMTYDSVIIPDTDWMEPEARKTVDRLTASGGTVLSGSIPDTPLVRTSTPQPSLRVCKRTLPGGSIYFLVNEGNLPIKTDAYFNEKDRPERLDPETGNTASTYSEQEKKYIRMPLSMAAWESHVYRFGTDTKNSAQIHHSVHTVLEEWKYRVLEKTTVHQNKIITVSSATGFQKTELKDWCEFLGKDFTGTVRYQTQFTLPPEEQAENRVIDLGDVKGACTVSVNDHPVGRKLWAPFSFDLPSEILTDSNTLTIDVSNTLSNLFAGPDYLSQVDSIYSTAGARYVKILETWEKETRPSGLLGPVQLFRKT